MSKNSPSRALSINSWLQRATRTLQAAGVPSARLDAELLAADALGVDRTWLKAHGDEQLPTKALTQANAWLQRRAAREPLAYIRGWMEFYGRRFAVNEHVLIPRPETEEIIELMKPLELPDNPVLTDVGTGNGCIAITAKLERPELEAIAADISEEALKVARQNAKNLGAEINFYESDLLSAMDYQLSANVITANLPYVGRHYTITPEAAVEPAIALYADDNGYELIENLLPQATKRLTHGGYLILESDPWQQARIIKTASKHGLSLLVQKPFHLVLQKQ